MDVEARDIDLLLELQAIDLEIMKAKKQRAELPQRARMVAVKGKQTAFNAKKDQIAEILEKANAELAKIEEEDAALADKQRRAQELIDAAGTNYRSVESHSREMGGFAKRRETLGEKGTELGERIQKVTEMLGQVEGALEKLGREEESIRASFAKDDGALAAQVEDLNARRTELATGVSAQVFAAYEKTASRTGGVAIGRLSEDGSCGICRSVIEGGRLIELKASAPLGVCPSCKRLLVIEDN